MQATAQRFHELHPEVEIHWEKRSLQAFAGESIADFAKRFDLLVSAWEHMHALDLKRRFERPDSGIGHPGVSTPLGKIIATKPTAHWLEVMLDFDLWVAGVKSLANDAAAIDRMLADNVISIES